MATTIAVLTHTQRSSRKNDGSYRTRALFDDDSNSNRRLKHRSVGGKHDGSCIYGDKIGRRRRRAALLALRTASVSRLGSGREDAVIAQIGRFAPPSPLCIVVVTAARSRRASAARTPQKIGRADRSKYARALRERRRMLNTMRAPQDARYFSDKSASPVVQRVARI